MRKIIHALLLGFLLITIVNAAAVVETDDGLCYTQGQAKPTFSISIFKGGNTQKGTVFLTIGIYGKQRDDGYTLHDANAGDIREHYDEIIPIIDVAGAQGKIGRYLKIKLDKYQAANNPLLRPATPQWQGKVLELKRFKPYPKDDRLFDPNNPKHRGLYFTVTVDGKDTYQCGVNQSDDE